MESMRLWDLPISRDLDFCGHEYCVSAIAASLHSGGDRIDHVHIGAATADVSVESLSHLFTRGVWFSSEKCSNCDHKTRGTETALAGIVLDD